MYKMTLMIIVKSKSIPLSQLTELNKSPQKVKKGGLMVSKSDGPDGPPPTNEIMG